MSSIIRLTVLAASMAAIVGQANAAPAPILTFSPLSYSSANTGPLVDNTSLTPGFYSSHSGVTGSGTSTAFHNVLTNALPGVAGHLDIYQDVTTSTTTETVSSYQDIAAYSLAGNVGNYGTGQWIQMSGTVSATQASNLNFSISAHGAYQTTTVPGIGDVNPAFPSLFFGFNSPLGAIATTSSSVPGLTPSYSVNSSSFQSMAAGTSAFSVLVYVNGGVSLSGFDMNIAGATYGGSDLFNTSNTVQTTLFQSIVIPALPVPEPETYAMLLAGLAMMGVAARRRNKTA